jgi:hypothetical protein
MLAVNQSSLELNERGPALKVFWPRNDSGWAQSWCRARLPRLTRVVIQPVDQKSRAGGSRAGNLQSAPFGSKVGTERHRLKTC